MSQNPALSSKGQPYATASHHSHEDARMEIERLQSELSMPSSPEQRSTLPTGNSPQRFQNSPANDEIDLLDLMRTLWGLRYYALTGAIIGAFASLTVLPFVVKTRYVTSFPVAVNVKSLPALSEPDKVVAAFNSSFGTSKADEIFESTLIEVFPDLKNSVSSEDGESRSLFTGREAKSVKDLPISIENGVGTNQYLLSVNLPAAVDDTGKLEITVLNALNKLSEHSNTQAMELHTADAQARFDDAIRLQTSSKELLKEFVKGYEGIVKTSGQIQANELRLMTLSKKLGPESLSYLKDFKPDDKVTREDQLGVVPPSHTLVYKDASQSLSRSFAILALLTDQKILNSEQEVSLRSTFLDLQQQLDSDYTQVQAQQRLSETAMNRVSEALRQRSEPVDRSTKFLPSFLVPEAPTLGQELTQRAKPSKAMTLALSVMLCGMLGLMIGFALTILPGALRARAAASRQDA